MIGYVTLGTNDLPRAATFYDALFAEIGAGRMMQEEQFIAWEGKDGKASLALTRPFDGQPATVGNGTMVALEVSSTDDVDRLYNKALELGATDEGPAGPRSEWFYAGYFRDPDGNKLNVFCLTGDMQSDN
ncbi:VOC family protein [Alteromonas sp. CYL-A6]|uniref:VOC family protein n=1 Tax=Alteromonas nitratireducens TaxID=3390813 RepID=UPI0034B82E26